MHRVGTINIGLQNLEWGILQRTRSYPHIERKAYHFLMGMLCFFLYAYALSRAEAIITLSVIGGLLVVFDILRLRYPKINNLSVRVYGKLMRQEELSGMSANSYYIFGLLIIVLFFPKPIVLLSTLYLAIGDPAAAIVGTLFGTTKILGKKSLEGALANLTLACFATLLATGFYFKLPADKCFFIAVLGGIISTVAELFPTKLDDNLTIPVLSAVLLTLCGIGSLF